MSDFKMSGENMNQLIDNLVKIQNKMNRSYKQLERLIQNVEGGGEWEGEAQKAFLAYMGLMREYHRKFTNYAPDGGGKALKEATDALKDHGKRVNAFYREFPEYKNMEGIK